MSANFVAVKNGDLEAEVAETALPYFEEAGWKAVGEATRSKGSKATKSGE